MQKNRVWTASLIVGILAVVSMPLMAQPPGRGPGGARMYNKATEVTVKGTVEAVQEYTGRGRGMMPGVHVTLKTADETLDVHLGPKSFLDSQHLNLAKGDEIEVTGSRMTMGGQEALIARIVKQGDKTFTLRDEQGIPKWAGAGRRGY
jgi:hypothetical protein